ncbi:MAG TPA: redoxin domain-containing protein [Gaiellaceae bacterium]
MELLRDRSTDFERAGVRVFGVSRDSPWTHIAWTQALDLNFPLVSDWNAEAIQGFGIAREFRGYRDVAVRSAFLADRDGTIRAAWHYGDGEVPNLDDLLTAAREL